VARIAGRNGRLYMGIASGGTAEPLPFVAGWALQFPSDQIDVTAMGDTSKVYLAALSDQKGSLNGFYDDATAQAYTAAVDGVARKFYLYPNLSTATQYWFGTAVFDFNVDATVADAVKVSAAFSGASVWSKVG